MISEKEMEDQVAGNPARFLGEKGLSLVARQYRVGSYVFDLVFEDRHGGKLIVELQKGTLDRTHTYKILDYYYEYREKHPAEFIDVMVIANQIPAERKKRLHALGVEFRELPETAFESVEVKPNPPERESNGSIRATGGTASTPSVVSQSPFRADCARDVVLSPPDHAESTNYHFRSLGPSEFVKLVREAISSSPDLRNWKTGGDSSLSADFLPARDALKEEGKGLTPRLTPQLWLERPKAGKGTCVLLVAYNKDKKDKREKIAEEIRSHLRTCQLPEGIRWGGGSTVIVCPLVLPGVREVDDGTAANSGKYAAEVKRVLEFIRFLDAGLLQWIEKRRKVGR